MNFMAAIILDKPELSLLKKTLEPYQIDSPSKEYLIFKSMRDKYIDEYNEMTRKMYRDKYGNLYRDFDPIFIKKIKSKEKDKYNGVITKDNWKYFICDYTGYTAVEIPYNIIWKTPDDFLRERYFNNWDEEKQDYGVWINPNGKWDDYYIYNCDDYYIYKVNESAMSLSNSKQDIFIQIKDLKETNINPRRFLFSNILIKRCYTFILNGNWYEDTIDVRKKYSKILEEILNNPKNQNKYIAIVNCHI